MGDGWIRVVSKIGFDSVRRSGTSGGGDIRLDKFGGGESGCDAGREEGSSCFGESRLCETSPVSTSWLSLRLILRPDSRSSADEDERIDSGGDGRAAISRGVGSSSGRGAGAFVTVRAGGFKTVLGFEVVGESGKSGRVSSGSTTSASTGTGV